jgi:plastocyanin
MNRATAVLAAALIALAIAAGALGGRAATPKLVGTVGPGFTIHLTQGGKPVKSVKAGRYAVVVHDKASIHNFVVEQESGGKFEKDLTAVPFVGTKTLTLTLKKGKWKFYCKPHEAQMFGFFTVK